MAGLTQLARGIPKLDPRWFAAFLVFQAVVLASVVLVPNKILIMVAAGIGGGVLVTLLVLYPWILVPAIVTTTALDITGRLLKTTIIGVPLTGFHLILALMVIVLPINIFLRRRMEFPGFELKAPLLMLLGVMAISLTYSPNQPEATIHFVRMVVLVFFMYLTQVMIDSRRSVNMVICSLVLAVPVGAIMGAWQVATGQFHLPAAMVHALGANVPRATGTFDNPNIFGIFMVSCIIPLLSIILNYRMKWWMRILFGLVCLLGLVGILATFSRSSWVSAMVGILTVLWLSKKLRYLFILAFSFILIGLALKEFVPIAAYVFDRFTTIFTIFEEFGSIARTSSTARVYLVMSSYEMFLDHPILGIGWRGFPVLLSEYAPPGYPWWSLVNESHTVLAAIMAELGIVGLLAALWFICRTLRLGMKGIGGTQDPYLRAVVIGLVAVFVSFQVNQSLNGDFANNLFWFFTGMLFAVIRLDKETEAK